VPLKAVGVKGREGLFLNSLRSLPLSSSPPGGGVDYIMSTSESGLAVMVWQWVNPWRWRKGGENGERRRKRGKRDNKGSFIARSSWLNWFLRENETDLAINKGSRNKLF